MTTGKQVRNAIRDIGQTMEGAAKNLGISRQSLYFQTNKAYVGDDFLQLLKDKLKIDLFENNLPANDKSIRLKFFEPDSFVKRFRATVHKTGKLGFTNSAAKKMDLSKGARVLIGVNQDDPKDGALYIVRDKNNSEESFLVAKAGEYFYINLSIFFNSIGLNYKSGRIVFDITEQDYNGQPMYKLVNRSNKKSIE